MAQIPPWPPIDMQSIRFYLKMHRNSQFAKIIKSPKTMKIWHKLIAGCASYRSLIPEIYAKCGKYMYKMELGHFKNGYLTYPLTYPLILDISSQAFFQAKAVDTESETLNFFQIFQGDYLISHIPITCTLFVEMLEPYIFRSYMYIYIHVNYISVFEMVYIKIWFFWRVSRDSSWSNLPMYISYHNLGSFLEYLNCLVVLWFLYPLLIWVGPHHLGVSKSVERPTKKDKL